MRAAKNTGYQPRYYRDKVAELRKIIEYDRRHFFSSGKPGLFEPIIDALFDGGDPFMVPAD